MRWLDVITDSMDMSLSPRGLEGVPGLPGAPQHEAGPTKNHLQYSEYLSVNSIRIFN